MLTILYFSAPWCGPCRAMKPALDKLEAELDSSKVRIEKINIDENKVEASAYNILSIPTFIFVNDSGVQETLVGTQSIKTIQDKINKWS